MPESVAVHSVRTPGYRRAVALHNLCTARASRRRAPGQAAQIAHEGAWWAARAQLDEPLTLDEFRRYDALTHQRVDVDLAIRAVADAGVALQSVSRSLSVHGRAEYVRASMGRSNRHP